MVNRYLACQVVAGVALLSCGGLGEPGGDQVASVQQAVQLDFVGPTGNTHYGVNLVTYDSIRNEARSTGAMRVTTPLQVSGSCGVTFVSQHYAITAAHCASKLYDRKLPDGGVERVPGFAAGTPTQDSQGRPTIDISSATPVVVEQFDTRFLNWRSIIDQSIISGTWPNWQQLRRLTTSDGYNMTATTCFVARRCSVDEGFGNDNCPAAVRSLADSVDLALVYCPYRTATARAPVATTALLDPNQPYENAEIWWFHEIVNLQTTENDQSPESSYVPPFPADGWAHYGRYSESDNYHYAYDPNRTHQMLPLRSIHTSGGVHYQHNPTIPLRDKPTLSSTNVPGCHGTSGSGVFNPNGQLLGPVITTLLGGITTLCDDIGGVSGANAGILYTSQRFTLALYQGSPEVGSDP